MGDIKYILRKETRVMGLLGGSGAVLVPTDPMSIGYLAEMTENEDCAVTFIRVRNLKHHRLFFGMLQIVFEAQTFFPTLDDMLDEIKIALGHFHMVTRLDGSTFPKTKSIAFASMDQKAFREFYTRAVDFILTHILPHTNRKDLEQRVFEIMGERGPDNR